METIEETLSWIADGAPVEIGTTRIGSGPRLLMLPALSSISTRAELRPLQERLSGSFETVAVDWPGFGELPRPKVDWRPALYRDFLRFLAKKIAPFATIAAGHASAYALAEAADAPGSLGKLCLLSPTWRGPLPTMAGKRMGVFPMLAKLVDLPGIGAAFYRLNVNGPVIGMMARGHVYADPDWLNPARMQAKRRVTEAPGARYASFRFVSGELDLFHSREAWLKTAAEVKTGILEIYSHHTPPRSKAEMQALATLDNVTAVEAEFGKLSFYEEFPAEAAAPIRTFLGGKN
ncbi:alpha/beta hydrolase [Methyloligella sp. 2.7D]|uniref:alpha/beta fold hydrolase n=1 Tax=unclassified Methyloligella TaxID=2625955 RepID=UPI00157DE83A|nr:alpha/beta hydrolase [Methyloligella sp. GL2]QKP76112.1 alpha/beta hydrolase [Methyloligella sp. GL2]